MACSKILSRKKESSHPAAVKGGGNCIHPNGKRLDFLATNVTKKLDHYTRC